MWPYVLAGLVLLYGWTVLAIWAMDGAGKATRSERTEK